ncbi:MAG: DegT/DnrJ/EryC1/StrS family aminotransferase [Opitutales bacterium]|nr:DegT/DnrJ/EryC1/StrS family aminotransferase [Opitutales bacterium]MBQ9758407.1 DegT/DnrJ/EryC1/StrS family aminotransferase [Opitutales bacterium]
MSNSQKRIWLSPPHLSGSEEKYLSQTLASGWIAPAGENIDAFESAVTASLGGNLFGVAVNSGTAAIHLGLLQLGVGAGDEVICQSFTFAASANPVVYCGGVPVFVDSEEDTWNMDPVLLEKAILDRKEKTGKFPKAIVPVHLYGMPAKMVEICAVAEKYGIPVLEDAAEALGAEYKGRKCGTFGEFAAISFNGNKVITTSAGGIALCRARETRENILKLATQARENRPYYHHEKIGYNYRMSNVCAAIGRGQMEVLAAHIARRREIHAHYTRLLAGTPGLTVKQAPSSDFDSNFWLTCILVDSSAKITNTQLRERLAEANIESRLLWKPMHLQPVYASNAFYGNGVSEDLFGRGLCLPSGSGMTDADVERVAEAIKQAVWG